MRAAVFEHGRRWRTGQGCDGSSALRKREGACYLGGQRLFGTTVSCPFRLRLFGVWRLPLREPQVAFGIQTLRTLTGGSYPVLVLEGG